MLGQMGRPTMSSTHLLRLGTIQGHVLASLRRFEAHQLDYDESGQVERHLD